MYINDGTSNAPSLEIYLNSGVLNDLPEWSAGPRGGEHDISTYEAIKESGYKGVQGGVAKLCKQSGLEHAASGRVNNPGEIMDLASIAKDEGSVCITVHVGWGIENDDFVDSIIEDILQAQDRVGIPIFVETHRATITQDMWRTMQIIKRYPELKYNGDFSHWYTGCEMVYGDWESKLNFIEPIFERIGFFHGRIGNPGHIQVPFKGDETFVSHFEELWTRSMRGFLKHSSPGDQLVFSPELLQSSQYYAQVHEDGEKEGVEIGDRWELSKQMIGVAEKCWNHALRNVHI